jgi:hypothetical protein
MKEFNHLSPNIFNMPISSRLSPRKPTITAQNRAFQAAVKPLLYFDPTIFAPKTVLRPGPIKTKPVPLNSRQRKSAVRRVLDSVAKKQDTAVSTTTATITTQLSSYGRLIRKKVLY